MIGWALRWVLLCCGMAAAFVWVVDRVAERGTQPGAGARIAASPAPADGTAPNTIIYPADQRGHVILRAAVNGAPIQMLVDTGASLVTLTKQDALAAGFGAGELHFNGRVNTANGAARVAPVTLREIRIDQFSLYDVPAVVLENLGISLLGMSFLGRLQSYEMRDGKLTIAW